MHKTMTARELAEKLLETPDLLVYTETLDSDRDGDYFHTAHAVDGVSFTPSGVFIKTEHINYQEEDSIRKPSMKPRLGQIRIVLNDNCSNDFFPLGRTESDSDGAYFFENLLDYGYHDSYDNFYNSYRFKFGNIELDPTDNTIYDVLDVKHVVVGVDIDENWNVIDQTMSFEEAFAYFIEHFGVKPSEEV